MPMGSCDSWSAFFLALLQMVKLMINVKLEIRKK